MNIRFPKAATVVAARRDLCLDFANTLFWRGSAREETMRGFPDLISWCANSGLLDREAADRIARWSERRADEAAEIFRDAIDAREVIFRILFAIAEGRTPDATDVAALNRALERAPVRRALAYRDGGFGWRMEAAAAQASSILAPVLWSAADLIVGGDRARLRRCANNKCLWLFLDESRNGSRRWCSMQACGNRAKAHRHYLKTRSA